MVGRLIGMLFFALILVLPSAGMGQARDPGLKAVADSSTDIAVVQVVSTNPRKAVEGARDTAQLKVIRPLKGTLEPEKQIGVFYSLIWLDTKSWILEKSKFEKGGRYIVFLTNKGGSGSSDYELTDQWCAVQPESPLLEREIFTALNDVGAVWSDYWRRQHKKAMPSMLNIEIVTDAVVAKKDGGLILPVKIINRSTEELHTHLAHEWHGGEAPATDLYAATSSVQTKEMGPFQPVYLNGEQKGNLEETRIAPGASIDIELRMDGRGGGDDPAKPLMKPPQNEYYVRVLMVFTVSDRTQYTVSTTKYARLAADGG